MSRGDRKSDRTTKTTEHTTPGRVKQICQRFLEHSDSGLAHRLQEEEYAVHFDRNRTHRRDSRLGTQAARNIEEEEKQAFVAKQQDFYQQKQKIEQNDISLARQLQEEAKIPIDSSNQTAYNSHYQFPDDQDVYEKIDRRKFDEDTSCDEQLARILQEEELASTSDQYSHLKSTFV